MLLLSISPTVTVNALAASPLKTGEGASAMVAAAVAAHGDPGHAADFGGGKTKSEAMGNCNACVVNSIPS